MKKNLFLAGALFMGMTIATGCSTEESLGQIIGEKTIVEATIENGDSRTSVNSLYQVVWTTGDAFSVWGSNVENSVMTLLGVGGTTKGEFTGDNITLTNGDVALFPSVEGNDKTYTFKSEYTSTETDAPMLGTYNGTSFSFKQLAAMLRIGASGLTAGTEYTLIITSTGDQALTGAATLNEGDALIPTGEGVGKTITVKLTPAAGVTSLTFDAPIPAQTYTGLKVELKADDADDTTVLREVSSFEAKAGVLYEATTTVASMDDLKKALAQGGTIDLGAPVTLKEPLAISENTTIELNGNTLDAGAHSIIVAEGKTLTIQNAASLSRSSSAPTITATGIVIRASKKSVINIGEGVNISSTGGCCVFVPSGVDDVIVNIAGNLSSRGNFAAVQTSGNEGTSAIINITGGNITSVCEGVYFPSKVSLNISGGTITGTTAVYQKSGNLTISGGTLIATGNQKEYSYNGNGCNATGDALVIEACEYPNGVPAVSITGGTFISQNAKAIGYYQQSEEYKLANEKFVTGGTFSDISVFDFLAPNADVNVKFIADKTITSSLVVPKTCVVDLDLNGYDLSYTVDNTGASAIFVNNGTLNVSNTGANKDAQISFVAVNPDSQVIPSYATNTITNEGALVIGENVTVTNGSDGGASYAVDDKGVFTLNGGTLIGNRCALRIAKYNQDDVKFTMNGGTVRAQTPAWIQLPGSDSAVAPKITVVINDGVMETTKMASSENDVLYTYSFGNSHANTSVTINGGQFLGGTVSIGAGYKGDVPMLDITGGKFDYDVLKWLENDSSEVLHEATNE